MGQESRVYSGPLHHSVGIILGRDVSRKQNTAGKKDSLCLLTVILHCRASVSCQLSETQKWSSFQAGMCKCEEGECMYEKAKGGWMRERREKRERGR